MRLDLVRSAESWGLNCQVVCLLLLWVGSHTCLFEGSTGCLTCQAVVAGVALVGGGNACFKAVLPPTPNLAKECSDILFRFPHPWLTLDVENKELNSSHVGAPCPSGLNAPVGTFY